HVGELEGDRLLLRDRDPEGPAVFGIVSGVLERGAGDAACEGRRGDAAGVDESLEIGRVATESAGGGYLDAVERDPERVESLDPHVLLASADAKAGRAAFDDECPETGLRRGIDEDGVCRGRERDETLAAGEHPARPLPRGPGTERGRVEVPGGLDES